MNKRTKLDYLSLFKQKTWAKADIQRLTKFLNGVRFTKDDDRRAFSLEFQAKFDELWNKPRLLTEEHSTQGINYLRDYCWTTKGVVRKSCRAFNEDEREIVKNFKSFAFIGWHIETNDFGDTFFHIVYRTYAKDGSYFDYIPMHWGDPIIVENGYARKGNGQ